MNYIMYYIQIPPQKDKVTETQSLTLKVLYHLSTLLEAPDCPTHNKRSHGFCEGDPLPSAQEIYILLFIFLPSHQP